MIRPWGGGVVTKSCLTLSTPWTIALQALLSMGFPRQEYWSGLPFPSPGDLPQPGIEPEFPALVGGFSTDWTTKEAQKVLHHSVVFSCVRLFGIPWTAACQASLSMGFYTSLRRLERIVIPFSRGSSQLRDRTQVSCIAGGFFTIWDMRGSWGHYTKWIKSEEDKYYTITLIYEILKRKSKTRS